MSRRAVAGALRERIRIDRLGEPGTDQYGNPTEAQWDTLIEPQPAGVTPLRGSEEVQAQRLTGVVTYEIRFRFTEANAAIRASDRAVNVRTGEVLNLRHKPIDPDSGQRHWLVVQAQSGVAT